VVPALRARRKHRLTWSWRRTWLSAPQARVHRAGPSRRPSPVDVGAGWDTPGTARASRRPVTRTTSCGPPRRNEVQGEHNIIATPLAQVPGASVALRMTAGSRNFGVHLSQLPSGPLTIMARAWAARSYRYRPYTTPRPVSRLRDLMGATAAAGSRCRFPGTADAALRARNRRLVP